MSFFFLKSEASKLQQQKEVINFTKSLSRQS
jgi:hypothetical protein